MLNIKLFLKIENFLEIIILKCQNLKKLLMLGNSQIFLKINNFSFFTEL
jgi:hypothetical protein